jgi:hypothetical protein
MEKVIHPSSRIVTDELLAYRKAVTNFQGGHSTVCHGREEYANADVLHMDGYHMV